MSIRTLVLAAALGCSLFTAGDAAAQATHARWELVVPTGLVLPTGAQRDALDRSKLTAVQVAYVIRPSFAVNATVGWARSRDLGAANEPKLDVFTYDVGVEVRAPRWLTYRTATLSPFAGAGVGARSYNYRSLDVDATHNVAAYASAGGELRYRRVGLRLEARDYVTGFRPLDGAGATESRNDIALMAGLRIATR